MLVKKWIHAGLDCIILKHDKMGHLCGYVGVPQHHPDYAKDYDDVDVQVHGGLTFAAQGGLPTCKLPKKTTKWFGFDCAHAGDKIPNMSAVQPNGHLWTVEEVINETKRLAEQLAGRAKVGKVKNGK